MTPKWLEVCGVRPAGVWLARADARVRRAAILELLPLINTAADEHSEHSWPLAQTRADVAVFLCYQLKSQLCMSGNTCVVDSTTFTSHPALVHVLLHTCHMIGS